MKARFAISTVLAFAGWAQAQANTQAAVPAQSADALRPTLLAVSEAMFTAAEQQDMNALMKVVMPDLLFVMRPGILSPASMPESGCVLGSYKISDPQVRQISPISAVLVYKLHQDLACNDVGEPAEQYATDNFVKQHEKWLIAVHTQTPAAK